MRKPITHALGMVCATAVIGGTAVLTASAFAVSDPLANLTANQIAAKTFKDVASVRSVRITASLPITVQGQQGPTLGFDVAVTQNGCAGSFAFGGAGTVRIVQIGKKAWEQPSDQLWKLFGVSSSQMSRYSGKWIVVTTTVSPLGADKSGDVCSLRGLLNGAPGTGWVKGKITGKHGKRELQLISKKQHTAMEVSDTARPLIVSMSDVGDGGPALTLHFSDYNAPVALNPPPPADVVTPPNPGPPGL
ncbi:MAG TPA: hypothetical protein VKU39_07000 [Streptosporangiaceae bacterium]|nr:hypothetical protein [Streptosporangiaceae bacterium]